MIMHRCNQQTNCSILASTNVFGDPCPGTLKYLEAHYQCVPGMYMCSMPGERMHATLFCFVSGLLLLVLCSTKSNYH